MFGNEDLAAFCCDAKHTEGPDASTLGKWVQRALCSFDCLYFTVFLTVGQKVERTFSYPWVPMRTLAFLYQFLVCSPASVLLTL